MQVCRYYWMLDPCLVWCCLVVLWVSALLPILLEPYPACSIDVTRTEQQHSSTIISIGSLFWKLVLLIFKISVAESKRDGNARTFLCGCHKYSLYQSGWGGVGSGCGMWHVLRGWYPFPESEIHYFSSRTPNLPPKRSLNYFSLFGLCCEARVTECMPDSLGDLLASCHLVSRWSDGMHAKVA